MRKSRITQFGLFDDVPPVVKVIKVDGPVKRTFEPVKLIKPKEYAAKMIIVKKGGVEVMHWGMTEDRIPETLIEIDRMGKTYEVFDVLDYYDRYSAGEFTLGRR